MEGCNINRHHTGDLEYYIPIAEHPAFFRQTKLNCLHVNTTWKHSQRANKRKIPLKGKRLLPKFCSSYRLFDVSATEED
jgi:hypothetical protein